MHRMITKKTGWKIPTMSRSTVCMIYFVLVMQLVAFATIFTAPQILSSWRYLRQVAVVFAPIISSALPPSEPSPWLHFSLSVHRKDHV